MINQDVAVTALPPKAPAEADTLAADLGLPVARPGIRYQLILRCTKTGLELVKPGDASLKGPVRVDFTAGRSAYRRKQQRQELLVRAVGLKTGVPLTVVDGTGGLGRDSFILATAGCRVRTFERNPIISALLADGLERALVHPDTAEIARRIRLITGDTVAALQDMERTGFQVDVIYLDPMFPERRKSARVKKDLQILQLLATDGPPPEDMLTPALAVAGKRVVVKRPRRAPWLTSLSPSHSLTGKTIRFDVYMT